MSPAIVSFQGANKNYLCNSGSPWLNKVLLLLQIKEWQPDVKYKGIKKERGGAE